MKDKILKWLATGEVGISSEAIAFKMAGINNKRYWNNHPSDPDDFKRCLKLIREIPEIRPRLCEMKTVSGEWSALIDRWEEVEKSFMDEVSEWLDDNFSKKRAHKTFELMQEIYKQARSKTCVPSATVEK